MKRCSTLATINKTQVKPIMSTTSLSIKTVKILKLKNKMLERNWKFHTLQSMQSMYVSIYSNIIIVKR